jgi:hypothetical protein
MAQILTATGGKTQEASQKFRLLRALDASVRDGLAFDWC